MASVGYRDNLFFNLTEEEKEEFTCSICCHILRQPHECKNSHQFCHFCITRWSHHASHGSCPMCRVDGLYRENVELEERINQKIVRCEWKKCFWTGPLANLETHLHTVYVERSRRDAYHSLGLDTNRSRQSERSRKIENSITKQNTALSQNIQKLDLQSHAKFEKIYKRIIEDEWQKLKKGENIKRRFMKLRRHIEEEDMRMLHRIKEVEMRKLKEIENNKRRVKSLDLTKEKFRDTSLRRSLRKDKEIKDENILQKHRIENMLKRRKSEKEKSEEKLKEIERVKSERSENFQRRLEREEREWKEKLADLLRKIRETEKKKNEEIKTMQTEIKSERSRDKEKEYTHKNISFFNVYRK
ncbi:RNA-binding protein 25-like [Mytilus edulis]|uniref:RNA-binding protein 25-like n=1 Tax=Mytilus edulis TaxID=6550 RepID=UPI0039EEA337